MPYSYKGLYSSRTVPNGDWLSSFLPRTMNIRREYRWMGFSANNIHLILMFVVKLDFL